MQRKAEIRYSQAFKRQVVADLAAEHVGLEFVGQQDGDHVALLGRLLGRHRLEH